MPDIVACRSEHEYAEKPVSLDWQGQRLAIAKVLHAWRTTGGKTFRVETEDGQEFVLIYDQTGDEWQIKQP